MVCCMTVQLFKTVAERGRWTQMFVDAEIAFSAGDSDSALVMYLLLAEMGFEVAQSNTAFLLEQGNYVIHIITKLHSCWWESDVMISCFPQ